MPRFPSNKAPTVPLLAREGIDEQPVLAGSSDGTAVRGSNVPEISVSELSSALKRTVEDRFGFVRLRGEISNYRGPHSSGHAYFCIKDEGARIDAVVWKTIMMRLRVKPEDGLEVIASGKITTFPGKSSYQIVVETLEPAGVGALMAVLEERRRKLAAEGLFDMARKRTLPFLPHVIGVVTSPTGAVIRDILHRVGARFPRHVLVWPVRVQGETSGMEVAAAIRGFNALVEGHAVRRPHVIIVARGGGSLEDLWGFNDEAVVRAAAESLIPLISAVGHETDWTLIDHAADVRAPTPTGAAEMALPVLEDLIGLVERLRGRQNGAALRQMERAQSQLRSLVRVMPSAADLLAGPRQRLDRAGTQLPGAGRAGLGRARLALARLAHRLGAQSPQAQMARAGQRLVALEQRLARSRGYGAERRTARLEAVEARLRTGFASRVRVLAVQHRQEKLALEAMEARLTRTRIATLERTRSRLDRLQGLLGSLGYRGVLARGYAIVHGPDGLTLRSAEAARSTARYSIEFADGRVDATANSLALPDAAAARPTPPRRRGAGRGASGTPQGSLFDS